MFSIFSMFSNFHVLDVFQTYSMVSHLRWQDSTICRALTVTNCTYETETTNHDISSVLQSCDDRKHHSHFLYDNVLSRQAMAVEFSGMQAMININQVCTSQVSFSPANFNLANSIVHIVQHLLIAHRTTMYTLPTLPPFHRAHFTTPSYYTLYNFVRPPYPPCLDGLVQRLGLGTQEDLPRIAVTSRV